MHDSNELIMDVSGAWVREVSPMLATSRLFSPEHLGRLSCERNANATGDNDKQQKSEPLN
jgi:hypothetical protein